MDEAIIVDEDGQIVDGWQRNTICEELGIFCPRQVRKFGSEAEKFELALMRNCSRRQMDRKQKKALISTYLRVDSRISDNWLATIIGGIGKNHVAQVRANLIASGAIKQHKTLRGRDGKHRPNKYAKIMANSPAELSGGPTSRPKLAAVMRWSIYGHDYGGKTVRKEFNQRAWKDRNSQSLPHRSNSIRLFNCRFQELEKVAGIRPGSAQMVLVDPPYGKDFLPELPALAQFAASILKPGGVLVMHQGQFHLPQVMTIIAEHLTYRWVIASVWTGDGNLIHPLHITNTWKPILLFSQGPWTGRGRIPDVSLLDHKEKSLHPWQQPLDEAERLISFFSDPGDLIADPCGGSFTNAIASRNLERRFVGCDHGPRMRCEGPNAVGRDQAGLIWPTRSYSSSASRSCRFSFFTS